MADLKSNDLVEPELRKSAAVVVPGMFYYLAPVALVVIVALFALWLLNSREDAQERAVPTTGIEQEAEPQHDSPEDEREFRGGDQR